MDAAARVEPLALADAEAWARFIGTERARTYAGLVHDGFEADQLARVAEHVDEIRHGIASGIGRFAIAWHDGAIVGAASTTASPMGWESFLDVAAAPASRALDSLYVAPGQQGTGLADRLLALVLDDEPTVLWLISGNERARRFYERRGFALWGEEVSTGESWNHVPMRRMLRPAVPATRG